jgi:hypothetical protein
MSVVAAAVVGSTIVGAWSTDRASDRATEATLAGADSAAQAQMYSTDRQIEEIQRQFDYQQQILQPLVQNQYASQGAFLELMGINRNVQMPVDFNSPTRNTNLSGGGNRTSTGAPTVMGPANAATGAIRNTLYAQPDGSIRLGSSQGPLTVGPDPNTLPRSTGQQPPRNMLSSQMTSDQRRAAMDAINAQLGPIIDQINSLPPGDPRLPALQAERTRLGNERANLRSNAPAGITAEQFVRQNGVNALNSDYYNEFQTGPNGGFIDPNLNQTRLADSTRMESHVRNNLLAAPTVEQDGYFNYIANNSVAANSLDDDLRFGRARDVTNAGETLQGDDYYQDVAGRSTYGDIASRSVSDDISGRSVYNAISGRSLADGVASQSIVGEEFQTSPGYEFAVEEMNRALERQNSAGGNYGGRAIMEAQRRAQGLANQDYYNWVSARNAEVNRLVNAEATDIARMDNANISDITRMDQANYQDASRLDQAVFNDASRLDAAGANYLVRRSQDIARGDQAVDAYVADQRLDTQRQDQAYMNYMALQQGDVARLDAAVAENDRLQAVDIQRQDQAYYNYLANLASASGFGNSVGQAVSSSQGAASGVAGAYANQGDNLSSIYQQAGADQADIQADRYNGFNNAIQGGVRNWLTVR